MNINKTAVILGMGKSGTSLVSQILFDKNKLSYEQVFNPINFIKEKRTIKKNYYEFYENLELKRINKKNLKLEIKNKINHNLLNLNQNIEDLKNNHDSQHNIKFIILKNKRKVIFKDPRTIINFEFWDKNLLYKNYIGVFRNPNNTCYHYLRPFLRKKKIKINKKNLKLFLKTFKLKIRFELNKFIISMKLYRTWYLFNSRLLKLCKENKLKSLLYYEELYTLKPYTTIKIKKINDYPLNIYMKIGKFYCDIFVGSIDNLLNELKLCTTKFNKKKILDIII